MDHITVRQAVIADLEVLSALFDHYRQFQGQASDLQAARAFLRARFDHGESVVFLAQCGDKPAGFAQLYPSFSSVSLARVLILNDLFVAESARRSNVASGLLAAVESYAWSVAAVRVSLNVARTNKAAQSLYEARGWKQDGEFLMFHRFAPR